MAEGNALGKGPVIFHLYDSGIEFIRDRAAGESHVCTDHGAKIDLLHKADSLLPPGV